LASRASSIWSAASWEWPPNNSDVTALASRAVVLADGSRLFPDAIVAATGCHPGLEPLVGRTLGDWEDVPLRGRTVTICFDSDARLKRNILRAMIRVGRWLKSKGVHRVYYLIVPAEVNGAPVKGVDDSLAAGVTLQQFKAVRTTTEPTVKSTDDTYSDARSPSWWPMRGSPINSCWLQDWAGWLGTVALGGGDRGTGDRGPAPICPRSIRRSGGSRAQRTRRRIRGFHWQLTHWPASFARTCVRTSIPGSNPTITASGRRRLLVHVLRNIPRPFGTELPKRDRVTRSCGGGTPRSHGRWGWPTGTG
jgi:Domain of unknown function (DUF3854)